MYATVRGAAIASVFLVLAPSSPLAVASGSPRCTPEEEAAYEPFRADTSAAGCDVYTFQTCSDDCLATLQVDLAHAPECTSSVGRFYDSYRETTQQLVTRCESVRANSTNKYVPQVVAGVPKCDYEVWEHFRANKTFIDCAYPTIDACSDECLAILEDKISTAPVCTFHNPCTLGEETKEFLVKCLVKRNETIKDNTVMNTVATVRDAQSSAERAARWTVAAAVGLVGVLLSVI